MNNEATSKKVDTKASRNLTETPYRTVLGWGSDSPVPPAVLWMMRELEQTGWKATQREKGDE